MDAQQMAVFTLREVKRSSRPCSQARACIFRDRSGSISLAVVLQKPGKGVGTNEESIFLFRCAPAPHPQFCAMVFPMPTPDSCEWRWGLQASPGKCSIEDKRLLNSIFQIMLKKILFRTMTIISKGTAGASSQGRGQNWLSSKHSMGQCSYQWVESF